MQADDAEPALFSVVTVVRNDLDGFRRTEESLQSQTFRDFEWLVIDGASTDGTAEAVLAVRQAGCVALSEPDKGIYDAMNKGLSFATGRYVVFMNAGDIFTSPAVLELVANALRDDPADIVYGSSIMKFGSSEILRKVKAPEYIWHGQPALHQATFYRTDLHKRYPYNISIGVCADYEALARMHRDAHRAILVNEILSTNDFSEDSASGRRKLQMIRECARIQREVLGSSFARVALSAMRRAGTSAAARALTLLHEMRATSGKEAP